MAEVRLDIVANASGITQGIRNTQGQLGKLDKETQKYRKTANNTFDSAAKKSNDFSKAVDNSGKSLSSGIDNLTKFAAAAGVAFSVVELKNYTEEVTKLAASAEGVATAFNNLFTPQDLEQLKQATAGTVSEFQLMQAAVNASNFDIPLETLVAGFEFATIRAQETGQSVDYLVESIVTGIGRQSPLILDNLGISATQLKEEFEATGDFAGAVGKIINEELAQSNGVLENAGTQLARNQAEFERIRIELGQRLLPVQLAIEKAQLAFADAVGKTVSFIEENREAIIGLATAYGVYEASSKLASLGSLSVARNLVRVRQAIQAINVAVRANPIGAIAAALTVAAGVALTFARRMREANEQLSRQEQINQDVAASISKVEENIASESASVKTLIDTLRDENATKEQKDFAINKLNQSYGDYIGNLNLETASLEQINALEQQILKSLQQKIILQAFEEELAAAYKEQAQALKLVQSAQDGVAQTQKEILEQTDLGGFGQQQVQNLQKGSEVALGIAENNLALAEEKVATVTSEFQRLAESLGFDLLTGTEIASKGITTVGEDSEAAKEQLQALRKAAEDLEKTYDSLFGRLAGFNIEDAAKTPVQKVVDTYQQTRFELERLENQLLTTLEFQLQQGLITQAEYQEKRANLERQFFDIRNDLLKKEEQDLRIALNQEEQVIVDHYDEIDRLASESDGPIPGAGEKTKKEADQVEGILGKLKKTIADALGIEPEQLDAAIEGFAQLGQAIYQNIQAGTTQAINEIDRTIDRLNTRISETQRAIDTESRLKEQGLANDYDNLQSRLEEEQALRDEAFQKRQELEQKQNRLDSIKQISSLITASANIWKSFSALGPFGIPLAIAAIGTMFATFTKAKVDARNAATQFRKGGHGIFDGPSHERGGVPFAPGMEAEGGEAFGILSKKATRKHNKTFAAVVDALNKDKPLSAIESILPSGVRMPDIVKVDGGGPGPGVDMETYTRRIEKAIEKQGQVIDMGDHIRWIKGNEVIKIPKA